MIGGLADLSQSNLKAALTQRGYEWNGEASVSTPVQLPSLQEVCVGIAERIEAAKHIRDRVVTLHNLVYGPIPTNGKVAPDSAPAAGIMDGIALQLRELTEIQRDTAEYLNRLGQLA